MIVMQFDVYRSTWWWHLEVYSVHPVWLRRMCQN